MNPNLKTAIDQLYLVFAKYEGRSTLEGSPLYDDIGIWRKELRSKKLRELSDEDLTLFTGKMLLTWGDENDLKYYLPRILELTAELKAPYDIWTIYSRLKDADWENWDRQEQSAIQDFTLALWTSLLEDNSEKAEWEFKDYFHVMVNFYELLTVWEMQESSAAYKHLSNYVLDEQRNLFVNNFINSTEKNTRYIDAFKAWLISEKVLNKLEETYYKNETADFAEKLSWAEQLLSNERKFSS